MKITDEYLLETFWKKTLNISKTRKAFNDDVKKYLENRYNDFSSYKETMYRIKYHIDEVPKCPVCGEKCKFNAHPGLIYLSYCSNSCKKKSNLIGIHMKETKLKRYGNQNYVNIEKSKQTCLNKYGVEYSLQSDVVKEKSKQTCLKKYGVDNVRKSQIIKDKISKTKLKRYGWINSFQDPIILQTAIKNAISEKSKNKIKETCLKKYGVNHPLKSNIIKEKSKQTCLKKYGVEYSLQSDIVKEKSKQTYLEKYGVEYNFQVPEVIEKIKQTCLVKYGVTSYTQTTQYKNYMNIIKDEWLQHQFETKRKNHTFNTSKLEEQSYILLKEKYPEVVRQYKSKEYPYNCDFYIPSKNLYIECNYHWTHGGHPFNKDRDKEKLEYWKSKNTNFYFNAIKVWTISDVNKREIAKQNNLNYIEFWDIKELNIFLKDENS